MKAFNQILDVEYLVYENCFGMLSVAWEEKGMNLQFGLHYVYLNKGIGDAGSTADFRML